MKLVINNIGIINDASIDINGITVIVGENGTGKSTIGKALFCVFDSLFELERKIKDEKERTVERLLYSASDVWSQSSSRRMIRELGKELIKSTNNRMPKELIIDRIKSSQVLKQTGENDLGQLADKIISVLEISDEEIGNRIIQKSLEAEFADKILNVNDESKTGSILVHVKNDDINVNIRNNVAEVSSNIIINKQVVYIDDPYIVDDIENMPFMISRYNSYGHRSSLENKLKQNGDKATAIDEIIYNKKISSVLECMDKVCPGRLEVDKTGGLDYVSSNLREPLKTINLSTGLKSFVIIKTLLEKGELEENGIIILDEPEVHLHPEWQMLYAEMIVLLQKTFNINFLISTHSPDFLAALELYSHRNEITTNKYYFIEKKCDEVYSSVSDVTENIDSIYKSLSEPMVNMSKEFDYEV